MKNPKISYLSLILTVGAAFSVYFFLGQRNQEPSDTENLTKEEKAPNKTEKNLSSASSSIMPQLRAPQAIAPSNPAPVTTTEEAISQECRTFFDQLMGLDLQAFLDAPEEFTLPKISCQKTPEAYAMPQHFLMESCGSKMGITKPAANGASTKDGKVDQEGCYSALLIYRATIADQRKAPKAPEALNDPKEIAEKLLAKMFSDPVAAIQLADRLLELQPDFYPAAKLSALLRMQQLKDGDQESAEKILSAIDRAENIDAKEKPMFDELRVVAQISTHATLDEKVAEAKQIVAENPGRKDTVYLESWVDFQERRYDVALSKLEQLIKKYPDEPRFARTAEELRDIKAHPEKAPGAKIYTLTGDIAITDLVP